MIKFYFYVLYLVKYIENQKYFFIVKIMVLFFSELIRLTK